MKTTFFATSAILTIASFVKADNCIAGFDYCGHSLLAKGNYRSQLDEVYQDVRGIIVSSSDGDLWIQDLFHCVGGRSGIVTWVKSCVSGICFDEGDGTNDICAPPKAPTNYTLPL